MRTCTSSSVSPKQQLLYKPLCSSKRRVHRAAERVNGSSCSVHEATLASLLDIKRVGSNIINCPRLPLLIAACTAPVLLFPCAALSEEQLSGSTLELFGNFLEYIDSLGPLGPVIFALVFMTAEMIPLFPSQPLALASGLLFGPQKGAVVMCVAMCMAAFNAFSLSRGVGRALAHKIVQAEVGEGGLVQKKLAEVTSLIESGGFWKQLSAIFVLRLTPVVPFSAANYVLGVTPVGVAPFMLGTLGGVSAWSVLYASLGGASRSLLEKGADVEVLITDLTTKVSSYTATLGVTAASLGVLALVYVAINRALQPAQAAEDTQPDAAPHSGSSMEGEALPQAKESAGRSSTPL